MLLSRENKTAQRDEEPPDQGEEEEVLDVSVPHVPGLVTEDGLRSFTNLPRELIQII